MCFIELEKLFIYTKIYLVCDPKTIKIIELMKI